MKTVLHIGAIERARSNRLALQLGYADGAVRTQVLNLGTETPTWPTLVESDPIVWRKLKSLLRLLVARTVLAIRLARSDADLLHAHENGSLWAAVFWTVVLRRPAVWDPHDYFHERLRRRKPLLGRYNAKEIMERWVVRRGTPVLVVSRGMEAQYRRMLPGARIEILYSYSAGSDRAQVTRTPSADGTIRIVYPGLVKPTRLEPALIKALGGLRNVQFDVYGGDTGETYSRELADVISDAQIENVALKGRFSSGGIGSILAGYDFALFPFPVTGMNLDFCLPNKFYQCVEFELPMISTDMEEMGGLIRRFGLGHVFPSRRYDELARFLQSFDVGGTEYAAMVRAVTEYRDNHIDRDGQHARLLEIYETAR